MNILANAHIITVIYGVRVRRVAMSKEGGEERGADILCTYPPPLCSHELKSNKFKGGRGLSEMFI